MPEYFNFTVFSVEFLERGKKLLEHFDEHADTESMLYAALELRYAIEARLNEYIDANLRMLKTTTKRDTEYKAKILFRRLIECNPNADQALKLVFRTGTNTPSTGIAFEYTPPTPRLIGMHGRLGGLLHVAYFRQNDGWYFKEPGNAGARTLLDERHYLTEVVEELEEVTRGSILATQSSAQAIRQLLDKNEGGEGPA